MRHFPELYYFIAIVTAVIVFSLITLVAVNCGADEIDMSIIAQIESSNNPDAYNEVSGATGMYQITIPALADFNNYHKKSKYTLSEMFVPKKGYSVASWYMNTRIPQLLKHYGYEDTIDNRLIAYNWGISNTSKPLCKETRNYIRKYREELKK